MPPHESSTLPHAGRRRRRPEVVRTIVLITLGAMLLAPRQGAAQAAMDTAGRRVPASRPTILPEHSPLNPLVAERSGLYVQPYLPPARGWAWSATMEYGSAVERNLNFPDSYLLDAELARVRVQLRHDLSERVFLVADAGVAGAYAGFADGFFESYHRLIRFTMQERDTRPHNRFGDRLLLQDRGIDRQRGPHPMLPTDARLSAGVRLGPAQTILSVTIPTAPTRSLYHRGTATLSVLETVRLPSNDRWYAELSAGAGYTPTSGALEPIQRTTFILGSASARLRLWGRHGVFATVYGQGAPYRDTAFPELDRADTGVDFGYLWQTRGGRMWRVGLTEDLRRRDSGIDLALKVSTAR